VSLSKTAMPKSRAFVAGLLFLLLTVMAKASPSITSFSPTNGPTGTVITITGQGFSTTTNVVFNGSPTALGDFTVASDGSLLVVVPATATSGTLTVNTTGGSATSSGNFQAAPLITSFSPPNGIYGANPTEVYIHGANFINSGTNVTKVTFAGAAPVIGTVLGNPPTEVEAAVPSGFITGPITVTTSAGSATTTSNFIASGAPIITDFNPIYGSNTTTVTIDGWNFINVTAVKFNGASASYSVPSQTQISATVPTGASAGPISVTTSSGTATTTSNFLTGPGPIITSFSPNFGELNTVVTNFGLNVTAATNVTFNNVKGSINGYGTGYLQTTISTATSTGPIKLTSPAGSFTTTSNFLYITGPYITGFSPSLGGPGIYVVINGYNFTGVTSVKFGGVAATAFTITAPTQITATVPNNAVTGPITVDSVYTTNNNFTVEGAGPVITAFTPSNAVQGSLITLSGANFTNLSNPGVKFNGVAGTYTPPTSTTVLYATVPVGATTGPISILNGSGAGASSTMLYLQPWISNSTASGIVNSSVIINGRNLTNTSSVVVGGINYTFTNSPTRIVATVPSNAVTGPIVITAPGGVYINPASFVVLPKIYSFGPTLGPAGTIVTLTGTSLYDVTNVLFNGVSATPYNVTTNQLQVNVPSGATPGYITVVTPGGSDVSSNIFTATSSSTVILTKTVNPPVAGPGTNVVYTIFLTNAGPSTVTSVSVTDNIPSGFAYTGSASTLGTIVFTNSMVIASIPILVSNSSATITVDGYATNAGGITNSAFVGFAEGNTIYGTNYAFAEASFVTGAQRTLSAARLGKSGIEITWPVSTANFELQIYTNLRQTNGWTNVSGVFVTNGLNEYTNGPLTNPVDFFRLKYP